MNRIGTHILLLAALLALALAASAGAASAGTGDGDPLGEVPALGEYVEEVPTAKGPKPTSTPTRPKGSRGKTEPPSPPRLSPAAEQRLAEQPKEVAAKLRRITSSSHYGASETAGPDEQARARRVLRTEADAERASTAEAFGTVLTAATTGGNAHLSVLLVLVLLATAAAVAVAAQRAFGKPSRRR